MTERTIAIVPARAGSVRLPGKNVRPMAGRPMVAWTLQAALDARTLDRVVVSTDDPAVAAVAQAMGVDVVRRPARLAGPDASVVDAIAHALEAQADAWTCVVLLQPTSPLRVAADVDHVVDAFRASGAPTAISTSRLPKPPTFYGRRAESGELSASGEIDAVRIITGAVYVGRPEVVLDAGTFRVPGCLSVDLPPERAWDVDAPEEFAACEALLLAREG